MNTFSIGIIGAGASGTLLTLQLLRQSKKPVHVYLINSGYPTARGIAYSTSSDGHLLNVRAARMTAFPDEPLHFVNWIISKPEYNKWHVPNLAERFVSRKMYGHYLEELLEKYQLELPSHISLSVINDEALDVESSANGYKVILKDKDSIEVNKLVLCTGNFSPLDLPGKTDYSPNKNIVINPWQNGNADGLNEKHSVLIVGSSLTMADTVISLDEKNFKGKIYALSRHGQLPLEHPLQRPTHPHHSDFVPSNDLQELYHQLIERIRDVVETDVWHEPVLEDLRPHTQKLWQQFPKKQKEQFLRHLNHRWQRLRHRLPSEIFQFLKQKINSGNLELLSGQVISIEEKNELLDVQFKDRHNGSVKTLKVQRVINCTGPEGNLGKSGSILIQNLVNKGIVRPCNMNLGYDATPNGKIISLKGEVNERLFTMGPGLKGILWESTAVPEIRVQAQLLAAELIR